MKVFLLKRTDGGVSVMRTLVDDATVEGELAKWLEKDRAQIVSWREVPAEGVPVDRSQRELWCDVTDDPSVDIRT